MNINILGTKWKMVDWEFGAEDCDGLCETTNRTIKIRKDNINAIPNFEEIQKVVKRHEIIHAYMFESGLNCNWKHEEWGHDETTIDWFALQAPKIFKTFQEAGCM